MQVKKHLSGGWIGGWGAKEVPSSPKLSTLFSLHFISPLSIYTHMRARAHTHTHTRMPGGYFVALNWSDTKSFFCLSSSFPFFFSPLGRVVTIGLFSVCVWVCMCVRCMYMCVSWLFHFLQLHVHNESKFNHIWKINSASITFVKARACCQGQPGC